jgi:UDP-GlcNAc:undecaprenyl-phosphate GlcNAc-1-phosphate transferase
MNSLLKVFSIGFFCSLIITPIIRFVAKRFDIMDKPNQRKIHTQPIPLLGGLVLFCAFVISLFFSNGLSLQVKGLIGGATVILVVGIIDDIRGLKATKRLFWQLIACLILIKSGLVFSFLPQNFFGFFGEWLLTILWVVGITNALNFLDGLDGLACGLSIIAAIFLLIISVLTGQIIVGLVCAAFIGSSFGFLPFNFRPATIFLGDAGSTLLGFCLATIAIMLNWAEDNIIAIAAPILILGVPVFDIIFTTIMRVMDGQIKSINQWLEFTGKDHFHHRLLNLGFGVTAAVLFIYFVSFALGLSAVVLLRSGTREAILLLLQAVIIFTLIAILMLGRKAREN